MPMFSGIIGQAGARKMTLPIDQPKATRSSFEKVSILAGSINICCFSVFVASWCFDFYNPYFGTASIIWLLACPVLTLIGLANGGIAFYKYRSVLGLALNLPPLVVAVLVVYYLLSPGSMPPR
jgi:hypothetical protein